MPNSYRTLLASLRTGPPPVAPASASTAPALFSTWLAWLEDCLARLISCIALDKFTDYVDDNVVAPVRETAAQALGYAAAPMESAHLARLVDMLAKLEDDEDWKVGVYKFKHELLYII